MIAIVVILGLAATSGGEGDNQLLLWNVSTGELASDLNATYRLVTWSKFKILAGHTFRARCLNVRYCGKY